MTRIEVTIWVFLLCVLCSVLLACILAAGFGFGLWLAEGFISW